MLCFGALYMLSPQDYFVLYHYKIKKEIGNVVLSHHKLTPLVFPCDDKYQTNDCT